MGVVKQYAILRISTIKEGFGGSTHALSLSPVPEENNHGKLRVFLEEHDAFKEMEKLAVPYSGGKYIIVPVYTDSKSI